MAAEPKFNSKSAVKKVTKKMAQAKKKPVVKDKITDKIKDDASNGTNPIPVPQDPTKSDI